MNLNCTRHDTPFAKDHPLTWRCFFLSKHYTHNRTYEINENGGLDSTKDTPIRLWKYLREKLRDEPEGNE
jgi:hypothetical protein